MHVTLQQQLISATTESLEYVSLASLVMKDTISKTRRELRAWLDERTLCRRTVKVSRQDVRPAYPCTLN
jgi:hypothetical protein